MPPPAWPTSARSLQRLAELPASVWITSHHKGVIDDRAQFVDAAAGLCRTHRRTRGAAAADAGRRAADAWTQLVRSGCSTRPKPATCGSAAPKRARSRSTWTNCSPPAGWRSTNSGRYRLAGLERATRARRRPPPSTSSRCCSPAWPAPWRMMAFVAVVGPVARVLGLQPWQAGVTVTVSGALWMLLARVWGAASDRHGRRPVLLFGVAGVCVAYAAMCLAIDGSLRLRPARGLGLPGAGADARRRRRFLCRHPGHQPGADRRPCAAAATAPARWPRWVRPVRMGLVLGPAAAAWLSQFSLSAPLYGMAVLPLLAWAVLWRALAARAGPRRVAACRPSAWPMRACAGRWRWPSSPCSPWASRRSPSASSRSTGSAWTPRPRRAWPASR